MFKTQLKALLKARQWTPVRLCSEMEQVGCVVSLDAVYAWLRGDRIPQYRHVIGIITATGCSPAELMPPAKRVRQ